MVLLVWRRRLRIIYSKLGVGRLIDLVDGIPRSRIYKTRFCPVCGSPLFRDGVCPVKNERLIGCTNGDCRYYEGVPIKNRKRKEV